MGRLEEVSPGEQQDQEDDDILSTTEPRTPEALLLEDSNHLSALLLSPESSLLTSGLVLDGDPSLESVWVLLLWSDECCGDFFAWCSSDTERCACGRRG